MRGRLAHALFVAIVLAAAAGGLVPAHTAAATTLVQSSSTTASGTSVSLSYGTTPVAGNLLVVVCSTNAAATITTPAGFSVAISGTGNPAQAIFYKVAAGTESSIQCAFSAGGTAIIQLYEYSGVENVAPLDAVNTTSSMGSTGTGSSGSVTTLNTNDLLLAAITDDGSGGITGTWGNSFTNELNSSVGGSPSKRVSYSSADLSVGSAGAYSTTVTVPASSWQGQIAAFKIAPAAAFFADIVDATGTTVATPSVTMSATPYGFTCQTATGTLGVASQKIRITNTTPADSNGWNLTMAASTANWSDGAGHTYTYNSSAGSPAGCTTGQLHVNPTTAVITPESAPEYGCTNTGITTAAASAFTGSGAATLVQAGATASHYCYWDVTGIALSQVIPAIQQSGSYSIGFTLTLTAL